jgi:predicted FMN-binding regulatory protein PaiB
MYVPKSSARTTSRVSTGFIRAWSFALMVTDVDGVPAATHLPFVLDRPPTARGGG